MPPNYNLDQDISYSNFTMLIYGYFRAEQTGEYQFKLDRVDDLIYINLGSGNAFECCQTESSIASPGQYILFAEWSETQRITSTSVTVDLVGGVYYPIRFLYVNRDNVGALKISVTDPSGVNHVDLGGFAFGGGDLPNDQKCDVPPVTTTAGWTQTYTSTYTTVSTYTNTYGTETTGNVIVV